MDQQNRLRTGLLQQVEAEKNFLLAGDPKYIEVHARRSAASNDALIKTQLARRRRRRRQRRRPRAASPGRGVRRLQDGVRRGASRWRTRRQDGRRDLALGDALEPEGRAHARCLGRAAQAARGARAGSRPTARRRPCSGAHVFMLTLSIADDDDRASLLGELASRLATRPVRELCVLLEGPRAGRRRPHPPPAGEAVDDDRADGALVQHVRRTSSTTSSRQVAQAAEVDRRAPRSSSRPRASSSRAARRSRPRASRRRRRASRRSRRPCGRTPTTRARRTSSRTRRATRRTRAARS